MTQRERRIAHRELMERRRSILKTAVQLQDLGIRLSPGQRRDMAKAMRYSERHVRRLLRQGRITERGGDGLKLDPEIVAALWDEKGDVTAVAALLRETRGKEAPSRRNLARVVHAKTPQAEFAQMRNGDRARRDLEPRVPLPHEDIGELFEMDAKFISIFCRDGEMWAINIIDRHSGYVPSHVECLGEATAAATRRALRGSFRHGLPMAVRVDNAGVNLADETIDDLMSLHVRVEVCDGYHPEQKGTIEAFHRLVEYKFCRPHPFSTRGPKALDNSPYLPAGSPPSFRELRAAYGRFVDDYNHRRRRPSRGNRTPAEIWKACL